MTRRAEHAGSSAAGGTGAARQTAAGTGSSRYSESLDEHRPMSLRTSASLAASSAGMGAEGKGASLADVSIGSTASSELVPATDTPTPGHSESGAGAGARDVSFASTGSGSGLGSGAGAPSVFGTGSGSGGLRGRLSSAGLSLGATVGKAVDHAVGVSRGSTRAKLLVLKSASTTSPDLKAPTVASLMRSQAADAARREQEAAVARAMAPAAAAPVGGTGTSGPAGRSLPAAAAARVASAGGAGGSGGGGAPQRLAKGPIADMFSKVTPAQLPAAGSAVGGVSAAPRPAGLSLTGASSKGQTRLIIK